MLTNIDKTTPLGKNTILEPGETFSYNCSILTLATALPDDENTVTVNSVTADTFKAPVSSSAKTGAVYDSTQFNITVEIFNGNAFNPTT